MNRKSSLHVAVAVGEAVPRRNNFIIGETENCPVEGERRTQEKFPLMPFSAYLSAVEKRSQNHKFPPREKNSLNYNGKDKSKVLSFNTTPSLPRLDIRWLRCCRKKFFPTTRNGSRINYVTWTTRFHVGWGLSSDFLGLKNKTKIPENLISQSTRSTFN